MREKERPRGANHSEKAARIQESTALVSSDHAATRNDKRVSMSPHAEADVFVREQHSSQTQPVAPEREASSVDLGEYKGLKEQVHNLTEERDDLLEENSQLRAENQELREKVERHLQQARDSYARQRQQNPDEYKLKRRNYM